MSFRQVFLVHYSIVFFCTAGFSQTPDSATAAASQRYQRSGLHRAFWGKHYRDEWATPVTAPVFQPQSAGYTVADSSSNSVSTLLLLTDKEGQKWWLRSVDKKYVSRLPDEFRGTFVEGISKDQVSVAHPFAALTVPPLAQAAGVLYTEPRLVYVPQSELPNGVAGNELFYLEPYLSSTEAVSTAELYNRFYASGNHRVDQKAFVRARLFDMFLGDWRRGEGRWRWVPQTSDTGTRYQPLPLDRDGAYTKFDGVFPVLISNPEELEKFKSFDDKIKNLRKFNASARFIDRQLTNEVPLQVWQQEAAALQAALTDDIIDAALKRLPTAVYPFSGPAIAQKLKKRRDQLTSYAAKYYAWINDEVEVTGTAEADHFVIDVNDDRNVRLQIFGPNQTLPWFDRQFDDEPDEIRLFGLDGTDRYSFNGNRRPASKIRIIDRQDIDTINYKGVRAANGITVNQNHLNNIGSGTLRSRLAEESVISDFDYRGFEANKGSTIKTPNFNNLDQLFISLGYRYRHQQFGKVPFDWQQSLKFNYSISQTSPSIEYEGVFHQAIGKWSLGLYGRWDPTTMNNFFGLGNESKRLDVQTRFYRLFTHEYTGTVGLQRSFGNHHRIALDAGYNSVAVSTDPEFYVTKDPAAAFDPDVYNRKHFGITQIQYVYTRTNDAVLPTKGFNFFASGGYTFNLREKNRDFYSGGTGANVFIPFGNRLSLASRAAIRSVSGETEFYQLPWIGGGQTLRGHRRGRFWGKTAFHNNNDLRFIWPTRNFLFSGRMGIVATFDAGRVWLPGEESNRFHFGYGGGILVVPFNRTSIQVGYALSDEDRVFNIRIGTRLF